MACAHGESRMSIPPLPFLTSRDGAKVGGGRG